MVQTVCDELDLVNGDVAYTNVSAVGSTATHACNSGYRLSPVGGEMRTCTTNGWNGQSVTCGECILDQLINEQLIMSF